MKSAILSFIVIVAIGLPLRAEDFKVTVIAILASDRHQTVESKLKAIAEEIKKKEPGLTGWKTERQTQDTLQLNQKHAFKLVDDVAADVTVLAREDKEKEKRIRVNVKSPHAGEITYSTVPGKYFPVLTKYQTAQSKDRLIYAVKVDFASPPKE